MPGGCLGVVHPEGDAQTQRPCVEVDARCRIPDGEGGLRVEHDGVRGRERGPREARDVLVERGGCLEVAYLEGDEVRPDDAHGTFYVSFLSSTVCQNTDMVKPEPQIGYLLKQAQSLLRARMEEALAPLGLTVSQYSCLHRLRLDPGISASALARSLFMTRQSMAAMLQQLIDRGLAARPDEPVGGRALPVALTPAGADVLADAETLVDRVQARMLSALSDGEQDALAAGLAACAAALAE